MCNLDALFFFEQNPGALPIYEAFEEKLQQTVGDYRVRVQKTQITYTNTHVFACASFLKVRKAKFRPPAYLVITFRLDHKLESPRIDAAVEAYPRRWTHHVLLQSPEEVDDELLAWVREAYDFSASK